MIGWLEDLRYEYPRLVWSSIWLAMLAALSAGFMAIPDTPTSNAMGLVRLQERATSLVRAVRWYVRVQVNTEGVASPKRITYGTVLGLDRHGNLVISEAVDDRWQKTKVRLADVKLIDVRGAATAVKEFRDENARFEIYEDEQAVVWINGWPLNVKLIESGFADPDPNPPTNIVDKAFATYYWRNFYGNDSN